MKKSKMKPSMSGMGLQDEKLKPGKTKIVKAQIGRYLEQERVRQTYKDYKDRLDERRRQDQEDSYRKKVQEYQAERQMYRMPMQNPSEGGLEGYVSEAERRMMQNNMPEMKKGGMTKSQKKISKVMGEYKKGELRSGSKKGPVVKNPKQAIAIALSEAGKSKMKKRGGGEAIAGMGAALKEGGMVRGSGAAIKGIRKAKMY